MIMVGVYDKIHRFFSPVQINQNRVAIKVNHILDVMQC